ncbi:hypothetical protein Pelo_14082 [Pelomyxa schiedti]|nr:hypothetical protein Pelo_14082 [Pelomyxa schiedti]
MADLGVDSEFRQDRGRINSEKRNNKKIHEVMDTAYRPSSTFDPVPRPSNDLEAWKASLGERFSGVEKRLIAMERSVQMISLAVQSLPPPPTYQQQQLSAQVATSAVQPPGPQSTQPGPRQYPSILPPSFEKLSTPSPDTSQDATLAKALQEEENRKPRSSKSSNHSKSSRTSKSSHRHAAPSAQVVNNQELLCGMCGAKCTAANIQQHMAIHTRNPNTLVKVYAKPEDAVPRPAPGFYASFFGGAADSQVFSQPIQPPQPLPQQPQQPLSQSQPPVQIQLPSTTYPPSMYPPLYTLPPYTPAPPPAYTQHP